MKTNHPMIGKWANTDIPADLAAAVAKLPELPRVEMPGKVEWDKTGEKAPAGSYTNPRGEDVVKAVATVLASGKWTRRRLAVAMNFRTTHDLNIVRRELGAIVARPKAVEEAPVSEAPKGSRPAKRQAAKAAA